MSENGLFEFDKKKYKTAILTASVVRVFKSVERTRIWLRRYSDLATSYRKRVIAGNNDFLKPTYAYGPQTYYATTLVFDDINSSCLFGLSRRTMAESLPGRVESCVYALYERRC